MRDSNGVIGEPVSVEADVYPALNLVKSGTYYDIGYICANGHGKINRWAKYKPVSISKLNEIGESEREAVNFGFDSSTMIALGEAAAFSLASAYPEWKYDAPASPNAWRITDFVGYNHKAPLPFKYAFNKEVYVAAEKANLPQTITVNSGCELPVADFPMFNYGGSGAGAWNYSVIRNNNGSYTLHTGPSLTEAGSLIEVEMNDIPVGTYSCLFCATYSGGSELAVVPMPKGLFTVKVGQLTFTITLENYSSLDFYFLEDGSLLTPATMSLYLIATPGEGVSGYTINVDVALNVICYDADGNAVAEFEVSGLDSGNVEFSGPGEDDASLFYFDGNAIPLANYTSVDLTDVASVDVEMIFKSDDAIIYSEDVYAWNGLVRGVTG